MLKALWRVTRRSAQQGPTLHGPRQRLFGLEARYIDNR